MREGWEMGVCIGSGGMVGGRDSEYPTTPHPMREEEDHSSREIGTRRRK